MRNRGRVFNIPHNGEKPICQDNEEESALKRQKIEKFMADLSELHTVFDQGRRPIEAAWTYLEKQYETIKDYILCLPPYYKLFIEERYEELKARADRQILMSTPEEAEALINNINAQANVAVQPQVETPSADPLPGLAELDAFFESLNAATAGIPNLPEKMENLKQQANEMETEEAKAIAAIAKTGTQ